MGMSGGEEPTTTTTTSASALTPMRSRPSPILGYAYSALVFSVAFVYEALIPLISLPIYYLSSPARPPTTILSDPIVSALVTLGRWIGFFAAFYYIGKRVDFERNYGRLALLTLGGVMTFQAFTIASYSAIPGASGNSILLLQNNVGYVVSGVTSFGLLFGALSIAFLRNQLPFTDSPPIELTSYSRPALAGAVALLTSFGSPVFSGFVAALLYQRGLFLQGDQFAFLRYYFLDIDPLFVNYILYPGLFIILLYLIGRKVDLGRSGSLGRISLYLLMGGFVGYVVGIPLGYYLKAFFNPPPPARGGPGVSNSSLAQLYSITWSSVATSIAEATLLTLLGISVLTIALLRRESDLPGDDYDAEDDAGSGDSDEGA